MKKYLTLLIILFVSLCAPVTVNASSIELTGEEYVDYDRCCRMRSF
ncbi:hypothetical protein [Bacillus sp. SM2101]|nr:hypothetical protein [Bacillus sp. SM2101]